MGYGNLSSIFKPKEPITTDDIRQYLKKEYELDEDSELACLDAFEVVWIDDQGNVKLQLDDEIEGEDFDNIESEWKKIVTHYAEFADGAIHVTGDYDNYDDGEKSELDYYLGPKRLVIQAEIKKLEEDRDRLENVIAEKRRELSTES